MGAGAGCSGKTFPATDAGLSGFVSCEAGYILDATTPDGVLMGFAASAGCPSSGMETWPSAVAMACMRAHKVLYSKSTGGDCGTSTQAPTGNIAINISLSIG